MEGPGPVLATWVKPSFVDSEFKIFGGFLIVALTALKSATIRYKEVSILSRSVLSKLFNIIRPLVRFKSSTRLDSSIVFGKSNRKIFDKILKAIQFQN